MLNRCYNPNDIGFHRYGARGIIVCDRWRTDVHAFIEDIGHRPTPDHSLDRISNAGDYAPGNCRWATRTEQAANRRSTKIVLSLPASHWDRRLGASYGTVSDRLARGWDEQRATSTPPRKYRASLKFTFGGTEMTLIEASRKYGISRITLYGRIVTLGLSPDIAISEPVKKGRRKWPR